MGGDYELEGGEFFVVGPDGLPEATVDVDQLVRDARRYAFELAIRAGQPNAVNEALKAVDFTPPSDPLGHVFLQGLAIDELLTEVVEPLLRVVRENGSDVEKVLQQRFRDVL